MKKMILTLFFSCSVVLSVFANETPDPVTITFYHTSDLHENADGLMRISKYVNDKRAAGENVLFFDTGDWLNGKVPQGDLGHLLTEGVGEVTLTWDGTKNVDRQTRIVNVTPEMEPSKAQKAIRDKYPSPPDVLPEVAIIAPVENATLSSAPFVKIKAKVITEKVRHDTDDPAIWVHPTDPSKSLVIGTDKDADGALNLFNLEGKIVQRVGDIKRPNNVDVAYGLSLNGIPTDIAVTTERLESRLRVYTLPDMTCVDKGDLIVFDKAPKRAPMGIALYTRPSDGAMFAIVGGKSGPLTGYLGQYRLEDDGTGKIKMTLVREFGNYSGMKEIEAIAVDNELGYVYYTDELRGVRKYHADPDAPNADAELAFFGTEGFSMDREGVAIYKANNGTGYIVVSDQQANQFQIFPREGTPGNPHDHPLIKIVKGQSRLTDGCDVTSVSLPPLFPNGMFVAMSEERTFHYYGWEDFAGNDLTNRPFPFVKFPSQVAIVTPSNNATVHSNESVTIATGYNNPRPRLYWLKRQEAIPDGSWSIVLAELFWATCGKWQRRLAAERTEPRRLCLYAKRSHEGRGGGRASKRMD